MQAVNKSLNQCFVGTLLQVEKVLAIQEVRIKLELVSVESENIQSKPLTVMTTRFHGVKCFNQTII